MLIQNVKLGIKLIYIFHMIAIMVHIQNDLVITGNNNNILLNPSSNSKCNVMLRNATVRNRVLKDYQLWR